MDEEALKKDLPVRTLSQASNPSHTRCSPTYHVLYITQANNLTYLKLHKMGLGLKSSSKMSWACKTRRLVQWCVVLLPLSQKLPKPYAFRCPCHLPQKSEGMVWHQQSACLMVKPADSYRREINSFYPQQHCYITTKKSSLHSSWFVAYISCSETRALN